MHIDGGCKVRVLSSLIFCLVAGVISGQEKPQGKLRPAPSFVLPTPDGKVLKSETLKGKVVILDFFQTWCPDCQQSMPEMEKLYQQYKDQGLVIIGISHDRDGRKVVDPFVAKHGITFPILLGDLSIAMSYLGVTPEKPSFPIPYVVIIDRKGFVVGEYAEGIHKEAMDIKLLERRIKRYL